MIDRIADDIVSQGYCVYRDALPLELMRALAHEAQQLEMTPARIGRGGDQAVAPDRRSDSIHWIDDSLPAGKQWLAGCDDLRLSLNRSLAAGLFSFESHYARYAEGAFYERHVDAFRGDANRKLSLVAYLNEEWVDQDEGQLVLYPEGADPIAVNPAMGTLVVFLSEELAHEVKPARRERLSIAGWFRLNQSHSGRADPPS